MRVKTDFQIYERTHRSGNKGWQVSVGMVNGKRKLKSCRTLEEAEYFRGQLIEKNALQNPAALSELDEVGKASVRHALTRLTAYDASLSEAVDFFLKYAKPPQGKITIQEAMDLFKKHKTRDGASRTYLDKSYRCFFVPFCKRFNDCLATDITPTQAQNYIHQNRSTWGDTTKNSHNRHLRALYSFLITAGYAKINPFSFVPFIKAKPKGIKNKILTLDDTRNLLAYAFDNGFKRECAAMVLVLFCGVRVDEVDRLEWADVCLGAEEPYVNISEAASKARKRRVNCISSNAVEWLKACLPEDKNKGKIAPENYLKRMQRLRKKAGVRYSQNAARHSFASYHLAAFGDAPKTAIMLGHPNPSLLYSTYRQLATEKDGKHYFGIIPEFLRKEREARRIQKQQADDKEARELAEMASNCGEAIRDEDGTWISVQDETKEMQCDF
ncbi:MAG TPA: tyrosine-type recombinase/integrase [Chthoniobacteraceae bacterium]|nr:tyrosine-type recombinase/integrase [Chthoniobacteraceae bacterium]